MLHLMIPWLDDEEARAVAGVLAGGWLTQGPKVAEFERAVAAAAGAAHAVAVTSCTTALHLALLALRVGPGDEVVCPSMSFIATANVIRHAGATPVFADVDPDTFNLDPAAVAAVITPKTKAIMVVHQIGMPADLDAFLALGKAHGIPILEDAACALGSRYKGRPIGTDGVMACFSFHPRKIVTTGEGGVITTNNADLAAELRLMRHHGMNVPDAVRHGSNRVIVESYLTSGYNYRMTDLQAAVGIVQMGKLDAIIARRHELAARYTERLRAIAWLSVPHVPAYARPNFQSYAVALRPGAPCGRDDLMQFMLDRKIATRRGIMLAHREPAFAGHPSAPLPMSELASGRSMLLPLYPQMTDADVDRVVDALAEAEHAAVRRAA